MNQQVTVTTDAPVALKPLIASAIRTELRMLELGLERTSQRLRAFEAKYGLSSEEFERRFEAGEVGETLDFIEWAGEIKTSRLLQAHRQAFQGVRLLLIIEDYFRQVDALIASALIVHSSSLTHDKRSTYIGFIRGSIAPAPPPDLQAILAEIRSLIGPPPP